MMGEETTLTAVGNLDAAFSKKNIGVSFSQCTIDMAVLDPLAGGDVRIIDLSTCLARLKVDEDFLPSSIRSRLHAECPCIV
eukprot:scaffold149634_cov46-Attheya_sp.AAC.2